MINRTLTGRSTSLAPPAAAASMASRARAMLRALSAVTDSWHSATLNCAPTVHRRSNPTKLRSSKRTNPAQNHPDSTRKPGKAEYDLGERRRGAGRREATARPPGGRRRPWPSRRAAAAEREAERGGGSLVGLVLRRQEQVRSEKAAAAVALIWE